MSRDGEVPLSVESLLIIHERLCDRFEEAWRERTRPRIEAYLAEYSGEDANELLVDLLAIELAFRVRLGEEAKIEEYTHRFPDASDAVVAVFSTEQATRPDEKTVSRHLDQKEFPASRNDFPSQVRDRFRVLRHHAQGGLGEVFLARDEELNRDVALKQIQGRFAGDPTSRARFVVEAEVTAALEHPGVVPVYGMGTYPDGSPFYAMRFIRGENLKDAIRGFHKSGDNPNSRRLELQRLLRRFLAVCHTIAYAHSRGVLHRDLKPSNIMLGPYGETLIVDWGLAKLFSGGAEVSPGEGNSLRPRRDGAIESTVPGSPIGTPA